METQWAAIGGRVREARVARGLDQAGLGQRIGLERSVVAKIESGSRRLTAVELLDASEALQVPMGWLVREPESRVVSRRRDVLADGGHAAEGFDLALALEEWAEDVAQVRSLGLLPTPSIPTLSARDAAEARVAAGALRAHLGLGDRPLGSMADLSADCGVWLWSAHLEDGGASVDLGGGVGAAVVAGGADPGRRRMAAAQEIGHHVLRDAYETGPGVAASRPERERVVDAFAAELLLPEAVVKTALRGQSPRDALIGVAGRFRVSWQVTVSAAGQLGERVTRWPRPVRADFVRLLGTAPQADLETGSTSAAWQRAVIGAADQHMITAARAAELMRGSWTPDDLSE